MSEGPLPKEKLWREGGGKGLREGEQGLQREIELEMFEKIM